MPVQYNKDYRQALSKPPKSTYDRLFIPFTIIGVLWFLLIMKLTGNMNALPFLGFLPLAGLAIMNMGSNNQPTTDNPQSTSTLSPPPTKWQ